MEKIYTIPVNETFDTQDGCPFCRLYKKLEENELDIILGASMMEPAIRIETNKKGFCEHHFNEMFAAKNRLGLGLILESHIEELIKEVSSTPLLQDKVKAMGQKLTDKTSTCYICDRIENNFTKMVECALILWESDRAFREKFSKTPFFCIKHYTLMMNLANNFISKKAHSDFYKMASEIEISYLEELLGDVSWFCKKFDYRYDDEPWKNSKDAVERAIKSVHH